MSSTYQKFQKIKPILLVSPPPTNTEIMFAVHCLGPKNYKTRLTTSQDTHITWSHNTVLHLTYLKHLYIVLYKYFC